MSFVLRWCELHGKMPKKRVIILCRAFSKFSFFVSFYSQVITAFQNVDLSADSRKEMEEWISALKSVSCQTSSVSYKSLYFLFLSKL